MLKKGRFMAEMKVEILREHLENQVSVSDRVLKEANLLNRWSRSQGNEKPGFTQPIAVHQRQWPTVHQ